MVDIGIDRLVSDDIGISMAHWCERSFEKDEICKSLNVCDKDKAPRMDGFSWLSCKLIGHCQRRYFVSVW